MTILFSIGLLLVLVHICSVIGFLIMKHELQHFLLTRFNCKVGYACDDLGISADWLAHRFALFETFCLPSVAAQDYESFFWFIMIDIRTPVFWKLRLRELCKMKNLRFVIIESIKFSNTLVLDSIKSMVREQNAIIVSTRLDNDDALAKTFISTVMKICAQLTPERTRVINFPVGLQASSLGARLYKPAKVNPFASVMSPFKNLMSAFQCPHSNLDSIGQLVQVYSDCGKDDTAMWLQVIHSRNIKNRFTRLHAKRSPVDVQTFNLCPNRQQTLSLLAVKKTFSKLNNAL